jgi:hypothetical protein
MKSIARFIRDGIYTAVILTAAFFTATAIGGGFAALQKLAERVMP